MEIITYILTSLLITFGLFIGLVLTIISPEELKPGKKYFKITEHIIFYLIIFFSLTFLYINKVYLLTTLAVLVFYFLEFKLKPQFTYLLLSILFYLSTTNKNAFLIISSLLLIYSVFIAINFRIKHMNKNNWQITKLLLINYIWFIL